MDDRVFDRIHDVDLKKTMETSYIDYAMSVIVSRALPDVRDGLKPVQRRVLYSMIELGNTHDKPHRKSARIVGDTMGKYHPHGDSSIYGALVNMAQDWSTRYPLIDGHGNFGSVDGDPPAAMRYTEARLSRISGELLADINKDTVDFVPNFDETEKEPVIMPARFPNLLVNGATGIAVGMATNIPPHNLRETIDAVVKIIDNRIEGKETSLEEVMAIIKGPDFPTGAQIIGRRGIQEAYTTGRGKIRVRGVTRIETMDSGKTKILISELPYMVNKARLITSIADLVKDKKIDGITALYDHSSREGMEICIELRRDVNANIILNQLYKHTQLEDTFGVNMLALVDGQPKVLNLLSMLKNYLKHQENVVTRRTKYDLNKAQERAHILEGLLIALDNIDEVIKIVRGSDTVQTAKNELMARFGLSDAQAQAIVDMRLRALTGLERSKIEAEYKELKETIARLTAILSDENLLLGVIRTEILAIADKYGDDRRTTIGFDEDDLSIEDLIADDPVVITATNLGYVKRMTTDNFREQNRGGRGIRGMQTIDGDYVANLFMTTTHHWIMFFTNLGRVYKLKAYEIPEASRQSRGTATINLLQLLPDEKVTAVLPLRDLNEEEYFFMATKQGVVKRTSISAFRNVRKNGLAAITLAEGDELIEVKFTDGQREIFIGTRQGMCIRFKETDVRPMGRGAAGVRGIRLAEGDEVIGMQVDTQGSYMLIVSEKGLGKMTPRDGFRLQYRGGMGIKCHRVNEKTGQLIGMKAVEEENSVMMITTAGILIQMPCSSISKQGRITAGVRLMNLDEGVTVASVAKVHEEPEADDGTEVNLEETELSEEALTDDEELSEEADIPEEALPEDDGEDGAEEE